MSCWQRIHELINYGSQGDEEKVTLKGDRVHRKFQRRLESWGSRFLILVLASCLGTGVIRKAAGPPSLLLSLPQELAACPGPQHLTKKAATEGWGRGTAPPGTGSWGLCFGGTELRKDGVGWRVPPLRKRIPPEEGSLSTRVWFLR